MKKVFFLSGFAILIALLVSCAAGKKQSSTVTGVGISVLYDSASGYSYVVEIISGSPAAMAGLRSGDYLVKADSTSLAGKPADYVLKRLKGKAGSSIVLKVWRGKRLLTFNLQRAQYSIPGSESELCPKLQEQINKLPDYARNQAEIPVLPGFESASRGAFGIRNIYYRCKDSVQARHKFERLVSTIANCLEYTVADSLSEKRAHDNPQLETVEYKIETAKEGHPEAYGSLIKVQYDKGVPVVSLVNGFRLRY